MMASFDFSPLYRTTVGFDRIADLLDSATKNSTRHSTYPPYNIEVEDEDNYAITIAVAGFTQPELSIETENGVLTVSGRKEPAGDEKGRVERNYLYQGIANRNFERKFQLAEHVEVSQAHLENGLLQVKLFRRIPEAMKPKHIEIGASSESGELQSAKGAAEAA